MADEWNPSPPQAPDGDDRIPRVENDGRRANLRAGPDGLLDQRRLVVRGSASFGLHAEASEAASVWHYPVESVSSSDGGLERVWQGASISFVRYLNLAPGEAMRFVIGWRVVEVETVTLDV